MTLIVKLIKRLFKNKVVTYRVVDLMDQLSTQKSKNIICISIETDNNHRQFSYFTIDELIILYQHSNVIERSIYELMTLVNQVKAYIDFEYYIDSNLHIKNSYIGPTCLLKILYFSLNLHDHTVQNNSDHIIHILQQFLVLEASTSEKISYHFIHANPSVLFENNLTLGLFIKSVIHYYLFLITQHECSSFKINLISQKYTISDLLILLTPYVNTLRTCCIQCQLHIGYITIAEFAHLLVLDKQKHLNLAIDLNVYCKNQQFRLFDSIKIGKRNPLRQSTYFPFNNSQDSYFDVLRKSLLTYIEMIDIPIIYFKNNQFIHTYTNKTNLSSTFDNNLINLNKINTHINTNFTFGSNSTSISNINEINVSPLTIPPMITDSTQPDKERFTLFVKKLIQIDKLHQGYIRSCVRGNRNTDILFYNIEGNYRFCPRKGAHHQRNTIAILIDTKNLTYTIRCKDANCDNRSLIWKIIE
ncbi:unnamed protein product [Rotaria socialis]|uniref:DNA-directed primase/polymerase protein n=2 Tax=Rotaria socialis TaxID=392032 RepID=A0A817XWT9_9BILA|nr:unnamed protein product [Rotaria socialis]